MRPHKSVKDSSKVCHRNTLDKVLKLGGKREVERIEIPRVISPQRTNPTIFIMEERGTFDITAKGAFRKPRVLPNSNSLPIPDNAAHALKYQFDPYQESFPNMRPFWISWIGKQGCVWEVFSF